MNPHELAVRNWRIVFLIWFVLLATATHLPQPIPTDNPTFVSPDKLLHFICFGMLAFCLIGTEWIKSPLRCWLVLAAWAIVDEITQDLLPLNRAFSSEDLIAGELGIAAIMCWSGALGKVSTKKIKEEVAAILAIPKNWFQLGCIGFIVTVFLFASIWFFLREFFGEQYSSLAFCVAFLTGLLCVLCIIIIKGNLQIESRVLLKSMVPWLIGTIGIASMTGFLFNNVSINVSVVVLAMLVVGFRIAWNRAT